MRSGTTWGGPTESYPTRREMTLPHRNPKVHKYFCAGERAGPNGAVESEWARTSCANCRWLLIRSHLPGPVTPRRIVMFTMRSQADVSSEDGVPFSLDSELFNGDNARETGGVLFWSTAHSMPLPTRALSLVRSVPTQLRLHTAQLSYQPHPSEPDGASLPLCDTTVTLR